MKKILCDNAIYHDKINGSMGVVYCYRKATVVKGQGTHYQMNLCDDCANNNGNKLRERAEKVFEKRLSNKSTILSEESNGTIHLS